ncbi:MAG: HVO_0476 family zinc finger protein [Halobacteriaceae archaeon]
MEATERVAVACPGCSPDEQTVHEVLASGGGRATVRCTACGHVHKEPLPDDDRVERDVVVSQDGESFSATVDVPPEESLARGEEFVLETDAGIFEVRITDLQLGTERHAEAARGEEVDTIFTRAVGNVSVDVTVNPSDGGAESRNVTAYLPGDYEFTVGAEEAVGDERFRVIGLLVRDDAVGYDRRKYDHDGDAAPAKDLARVYGVDETSDAWSAW